MISRIHSKLGTAGLVVAIVALVAALTGAAFAAQGLNGQQKKEVKKIAKKFAGKPGAQGPAGPQGPAGKDGTNGTNGTNGTDGTDGTDGTNGQSVTGAPIAAGGACGAATGVKYTLSATSTNVCSGEDGETGFTETLPPGETETGAWAASAFEGADAPQIVSFSFNIPLAEAPESMNYVNAEGEEKTGEEENFHEDPVNCLGSVEEPTALPGQFCIYENEAGKIGNVGYSGVGFLSKLYTTGATAFFGLEEAGTVQGTWAVTAAEP